MKDTFYQWIMVNLILLILIVIVLIFSTGCGSIRKQIESEIWSIDPKDTSIFRVLDNGTEEFILCSDPSAKRFKAIIDADLIKWLDYAAENCSCRVPE